ncbi:coiled-coil domain-containing protein 101 [Anopheles darlingi]|uniref:Coiled-coil domain-containing protein 101 n=1 Tax=Anopheles darlingi TaxID=43151 RepID=W5JVB0_ANODA|nr:coiled-coil domain-containing protein 101 [Anopheles darlingi]
MPLTAEQAMLQVQDRLKALKSLVCEIETERKRFEPNINNMVRMTKMASDDKSPAVNHKLKTLYKIGLQDALQEEALIRQALAKIQDIRNIRNERRIQARNAGNKETIRRGALMKMLQISAQTLPLFVSKPGEKVPPLCGSIPADNSYIAKPGDMVAALVKSEEGEENWILAEVVLYVSSTSKYEVDDIDEEQKDRHVLSKRRIVPLPLMRANPETDGQALFPKGTTVMALYPQTTCFYKAIINQLPQTANEEYEVLFEDPTYPDGYSPPLFVAQRATTVGVGSMTGSHTLGGGSSSAIASNAAHQTTAAPMHTKEEPLVESFYDDHPF